jgi:anti-sigma factor NepR-like protein
MSRAESQKATMIKQRPYRRSATPPAAAPAPATRTDTDTTGKDVAKGIELGKQIGHKLKAMFEDVVAEPVPEKFRALLEELEDKSPKPPESPESR